MKKKIAALLIVLTLFSTAVFAEFAPQIDVQDGEAMYEFYNILLRMTERNHRFGATRQQMLESAVAEVLKEHPELFDEFAKGAYSALDENSRYLNLEEFNGAAETISGEFEGIGINVSEYNGITMVGAPIIGSPAYLAGIMAGDVIVSVDGTDIYGFVLDQTVKLIRGAVGTYVKLGIERNNTFLEIEVKRDVIKINPVTYKVLDDINAAYVSISTFNANTGICLEEVLQEIHSLNIDKVILDLRYNLGGLLNEAVYVASYFVPDNTLVVTEDYKDEKKALSHYSMPTGMKFNAVVLVNEYSASASEIVAAAIKENNTGVLVGTTTFGKGTVQQSIYLKNGGALWLTVAKYLTPNGSYIHEVGIEPDYYVENKKVVLDTSEFQPIQGARALKQGDSGNDVLAIEQRLSAMGYPIENADEFYDIHTEIAVTAFQSGNGLFPYGVADITTQIKIMDVAFEAEVMQDNQLEKAKEVIDGNF
ncbi:MAG: S41 family peptidase [Firmicutes bacterium]|nr:S41 family peptidase [Bacillota bacterium]